MAVFLVTSSGAAQAQDWIAEPDSEPSGIPYGAICDGMSVTWESGAAGQDEKIAVPGRQVAVPKGTDTRILRCQAGSHLVRINFVQRILRHHECPGLESDWINGQVSAWVDGVKVVDRRQWGQLSTCDDTNDRQLARLVVDSDLNLTTCDRIRSSRRVKPFAPAELKPGQTVSKALDDDDKPLYYLMECSTSAVTVPAGSQDIPDSRTPPGYDLVQADVEACRAPVFSEREVLFTDKDEFNRQGFPRKVDFTTNVLLGTSEYRFDLDNDGIMDSLSARLAVSMSPVPSQFIWVSGATGVRHELTAALIDDVKPFIEPYQQKYMPIADPISSMVLFLPIDGRMYVYAAASSYSGTKRWDAYEADNLAWMDTPENPATRRLYEIHPDGSVTRLCTWAPRKRPEEFL